MKLHKLSQVCLAATFLAAAASASASVVTYTVSNNSNVLVSKDTDWTNFLVFDKFDSALGTLTSVKFDLYSTINGSVSLTSYNDDATPVPFSLGATVALSRPDASTLALINATLFNTTVSVAAGGTYSASNSINAHSSASYSGPQDLILFSGPGSISTLIGANAWSSVEGDGIDSQFATQANGYGTVTYTYTAAVPEPETYGMMLLGLGMLGVVAQRKRATQA